MSLCKHTHYFFLDLYLLFNLLFMIIFFYFCVLFYFMYIPLLVTLYTLIKLNFLCVL